MQEFIIDENISFFYLKPSEVEENWKDIVVYLDKSVPYSSGYISLDQYKGMISDPNTTYGVWKVYLNGSICGAVVTRLERVGNCVVMDYEIMGASDIHLWLEKTIVRFEWFMVKEFKVSQFRIIGRPGWLKFLRKVGYTQSHSVIIRKNV